MKSLTELFRIGKGPSSSHTMGPSFAAAKFLVEFSDAARYEADLYGSLAATGRGHLTDKAIADVLGEKRTLVRWHEKTELPKHPNGMKLAAFDKDGEKLGERTYYSVGGGTISENGKPDATAEVYSFKNMKEILRYCDCNGVQLWQVVEAAEGPEIWKYLEKAWNVMNDAIASGLAKDGALPGGLRLPRQARTIYKKARFQQREMQRTGLLVAYARAVAEENAALGTIVTAPTCGSCGVVPAVLRYLKDTLRPTKIELLHALAVAGLFGNVVKANGSISGAEVGCQGEVGVACAMAAAAASYLHGGSPHQCETAAEIGLEHFLGLTCDPVLGLVQVPCIERNALAATRALVAGEISVISDGSHLVSFDAVVKTMVETGHDLPSLYRETSAGGLSRHVRVKK